MSHAKTSGNTYHIFLNLTNDEAAFCFAPNPKSKWLILQGYCQHGYLLAGFYFQGSCDQAIFIWLLCMLLFLADSQFLNS